MKTLYLVRHGKAIPRETGMDDFKRSLSKRGANDAQAMGKRLSKKGISPDLFVSSPADRALETAHIFAKKLAYPVKRILLKEEIYDEEKKPLQGVISGLDDRYNTVIVVGHEPALSQFASFLVQDSEPELRTAGIIGISLDIDRWQDIARETGTLILFDFPVRATPKIYKKARKVLTQEITSTMEDILEGIDSEVLGHVQKILRKTSKRLAKELTKVVAASKIEELAGVTNQKRVDNLKEYELRKKAVLADKQEPIKEEVMEASSVLPDHDRETQPPGREVSELKSLEAEPVLEEIPETPSVLPDHDRETQPLGREVSELKSLEAEPVPEDLPETPSGLPDHDRETQPLGSELPELKSLEAEPVPEDLPETPSVLPDHDREVQSVDSELPELKSLEEEPVPEDLPETPSVLPDHDREVPPGETASPKRKPSKKPSMQKEPEENSSVLPDHDREA